MEHRQPRERWLKTEAELARNRTMLSNERTLLSYLRTSLAFAVAGATLIRFFNMFWADVMGVALLATAFVLVWVGFVRYRSLRQTLISRVFFDEELEE